MFELNPESNLGDRKELVRKIPIILNFLEQEMGFDLNKETTKFSERVKEYNKKKTELAKRKEEELKKLEATAKTRSYELLFNYFKPFVNGELVDWNFRFKTEEYETVTIKEAVQEKVNVFVSHVALTDQVEYLNELENQTSAMEFLIRRKDGTFYDFPTFKIKRVR